jgi:hypothetical protein
VRLAVLNIPICASYVLNGIEVNPAQIGGYRVPCDRRAVTVGNEAMVGRSPNLALRLASGLAL